jgi:Reverse transcriptase (RNA-dependent DNA polymerase)
MELEDGTRVERTLGTPQGGVVSPILANLFMHYTFDLWMARILPELPWCRFADDGLVHCRVEHEAKRVKAALQARLAECHLEMHPTKTRIVYCMDAKRRGKYPNIKFDFLGYCFRPRLVRRSRDGTLFCSFTPAVSPSALKSMRAKIRELRFRRRTGCRWQTSPIASIHPWLVVKRISPDHCAAVLIDVQDFFLFQLEPRARSKIKSNFKNLVRLLSYSGCRLWSRSKNLLMRREACPKTSTSI